MLEEGSEVVVIEENEEEGDKCDEGDEGSSIEEGALELLGGGVGGGFEVDEGGSGADGGAVRGGGVDGGDEKDDEEHAEGDWGQDGDDLHADGGENAAGGGGRAW